MYVQKHSFLCRDHHERNSYRVVETRNSGCTWASIALSLQSCYLHSIQFDQEREEEFLVVKMCLVWINSLADKSIFALCLLWRKALSCTPWTWAYGLPASMSSPTCLGQKWMAIKWEDRRILLYDTKHGFSFIDVFGFLDGLDLPMQNHWDVGLGPGCCAIFDFLKQKWVIGNSQSIWERLQLPLAVNARKRRRLLEVAIRLLNLRTRLCGFTQIHTVYSGTSSMEEETWFLDMNPGIGLAAEVPVGPHPEEFSLS